MKKILLIICVGLLLAGQVYGWGTLNDSLFGLGIEGDGQLSPVSPTDGLNQGAYNLLHQGAYQ